MLSRNAQGLYWMGRYLERASQLCRLLELQVEALVDQPLPEIHFGWQRIYATLGQRPPAGGLETDAGEDFALADSYTLAGDLTFESSNPASVRSCLAAGRENARQMRHCISPEMWTCLNLAWLRIRELDIADIWKVSPEGFYARTTREIDTFVGVAEATMYGDEGWHFMRLGRFIERAQLTVALLQAQLSAELAPGTAPEADWTSLLRACRAFNAYQIRYSVEVRPDQVLELLVTDPRLPGSLYRSLDTLASELSALGAGPDPHASAAAERATGRLCALIRYEWPEEQTDRPALLSSARAQCLDLHELVNAAYIDYDLADHDLENAPLP